MFTKFFFQCLYVTISLTLPLWGADLTQEVFQIQDDITEKSYLRVKENTQTDIHIIIPQHPVEQLPNEILSLILLPWEEQQDITNNKNQNSTKDKNDIHWKNIMSLATTCKDLNNRIRCFFPALPSLTWHSSSISAIRLLELMEQTNGHLSSSAVDMNAYNQFFPTYEERIRQLGKIEPFLRFSWHFLWHRGSQRIQNLLDDHDIVLDKLFLRSFPLQLISSWYRDPYMIISTLIGISYLTTVGINAIHINNDDYEYRYQQAMEQYQHTLAEYQRTINASNARYQEAFQKNLVYAQSDQYLSLFNDTKAVIRGREMNIFMGADGTKISSEEYIPECIVANGFCNRLIDTQFTGYLYAQFTLKDWCHNNAFAQFDHSKISLSQWILRNSGSCYTYNDHTYNLTKYILDQVTTHITLTQLTSFFEEYFHVLSNNWLTCSTKTLPTVLIKVIKTIQNPYFFIMQGNDQLIDEWISGGKMAVLSFALTTYDPSCVATVLTPKPAYPLRPSIPDVTSPDHTWIYGLTALYATFTVFFILNYALGYHYII